jgi:hypothetical protein
VLLKSIRPIMDKLAERIRAALAGGMSVRKTAAKWPPFRRRRGRNKRRGIGK